LAGSRGAVLAVAGGVLAFGLQTRDLRAFAKTFFVTAMIAAALVVVVYRSDSMMKRYTRTLESGNMSGREQIFPEAWKMFAERPLRQHAAAPAPPAGSSPAEHRAARVPASGLKQPPCHHAHHAVFRVRPAAACARFAP